MRILHITTSIDPRSGGVCQAIRNLIPELEVLGSNNEVVCLDASDAGYLGSDAFPIHPIGPAKTSWGYSSGLKPWLDANLKEFDIVIQHGLWQYPSYALLKVIHSLRATGKAPRWYIYPHGMLDPWFQQAKERRLKAIRNWFYWKAIEHKVIAAADGLLFTCEDERCLAATTFQPYCPRSTHVVGLGIPVPPEDLKDQQAVFESAFPELAERPFLLFLSRIHPKKGVDLLLTAYAALKKTYGDELTPLMIAGPCADQAYWDQLQALAMSLGLQPAALPVPDANPDNSQQPKTSGGAVLWPGMLSGDLKWGALRAASAFILPSHQENFGIAVVEALACGTPVLISNKVNIWQEIEQEGAGIVATDDLEGTQVLLERFLNTTFQKHTTRQCFEKHFEARTAAHKLTKTIS